MIFISPSKQIAKQHVNVSAFSLIISCSQIGYNAILLWGPFHTIFKTHSSAYSWFSYVRGPIP